MLPFVAGLVVLLGGGAYNILVMSNVTETTKPHILIVDDDSEIRDLLSRFLVKHEYRVTTAKDGREMKKALADWQIDLIVPRSHDARRGWPDALP